MRYIIAALMLLAMPSAAEAQAQVDSLQDRLGWLRGSIRGAETNATRAIEHAARIEAEMAALAAERDSLAAEAARLRRVKDNAETGLELMYRVEGPNGVVGIEFSDPDWFIAVTTRPDGRSQTDSLYVGGAAP